MGKVFHRTACLSMLGAVAILGSSALQAQVSPEVYLGRWTVSDDKPTFSARGIAYKTIDIARCGKDYCGVSVGKGGACGPVLFRFFAKSLTDDAGLAGHGRWGAEKKNVEVFAVYDKESRGGRYLSINLGDGHNFGERSGNMPKFSAFYAPVGKAYCVAR